MKNLLFIFIALIGANFNSTAQKVLSEGYVKMEITEVTSDNPQMAQGLEMMIGTQTELFFNKEKSVNKMSMMGGMVENNTYVDFNTDKINILMNAMGNKMWIETNKDESSSEEQKKIQENIKVEYDKADTKEILGYNCFAMKITSPDMKDMVVTGYITDKIITDAQVIQGYGDVAMEGFPLEFTVKNDMMTLTISSVEIKDTVDPKEFNMNTEGYTKMTMEEFQKTMGGMGGLGF
ncbi:MAG TPA: hypothetical protein PK147_08170 [Saprospiraceae bacterium]|nr:hypothetical protein [Saprospiraceae bacterium]MCB9328486.1 hypothetical protein [Lewinellaceae bacterium]HPK10836.1 hypothetical protein [Saprospiraceae bacterium]HPQ21812.1 hypothetical protein [Saprospiraceae bacterium]HRX28184.1 hypothetical protein [Saprospiraceae bacterium]